MIVQVILIGMERIVFYVLMDNHGMKLENDANVVRELNGMVNFVL